MAFDSVSRKKLVLEIKGKSKLQCEFKRHLSPRTAGLIMRSLPVEGNAHFLGNSIVYLETPFESGVERPRKEFKKGDIAFLPTGGTICIFKSKTSTGKSMTPLGKIISGIEILAEVKAGDIISFYEETG
ncbi:MAG: hypothetical protein GWN01_17595 [Nitrosopumilaceae archaeon]|nr:hypothetical protein [Nitrosopumilaceae archaeon]NIU02639.1 hypothetical protein [Nitrosopumilaceae archaeon]NIU89102.1 hypothetical protein [Nitrosopumilaceae archaeon]NIV67205.1 hypothetical protein [Nitrosopumilaceae archaeon]NIX63240.1 hypothetical protein [Nitrosopumilaceae archaeon]